MTCSFESWARIGGRLVIDAIHGTHSPCAITLHTVRPPRSEQFNSTYTTLRTEPLAPSGPVAQNAPRRSEPVSLARRLSELRVHLAAMLPLWVGSRRQVVTQTDDAHDSGNFPGACLSGR